MSFKETRLPRKEIKPFDLIEKLVDEFEQYLLIKKGLKEKQIRNPSYNRIIAESLKEVFREQFDTLDEKELKEFVGEILERLGIESERISTIIEILLYKLRRS
jgi:alpha-galactosidase/6-phospho-beta-glucosidase family protein